MRSGNVRGLTRREVLAAGLATLATAGRLRADETPEKGPFGPFRMGLQSYSLRHFKLEEALAKTEDLGVHYWESFNAHIPADASKADHYRKMAGDHGIKVIGYGVVPFSKDGDAARKLFDFGKALGITYFSADPTPESFDVLDKLVEEYGISVGIHNHGPGHRYAKIDTIAEAIKGHHDRIGCCIDTGHFLRSREDPVRAVEVFDRRIFGVHLKDVKDASTFTILGRGDLRTTDLLKALARRKYNDCLALEYEENEAMPIDDIRACLDAEKKAAAGI
jgi:inosose dehydratase